MTTITDNLSELTNKLTSQSLKEKTIFTLEAKDEILDSQKIVKKTILYKPSTKKMQSLTEIQDNIVSIFQCFGFSNGSNLYSTAFDDLMKRVYKLKPEHFERMDDETKTKMIENGLIGIRKTFELAREVFFHSDEMVEEDFMNQRLNYLLHNQKEPKKIYSNAEYTYILDHFTIMVRNAAMYYFDNNGKAFPLDKTKELVYNFHLKVLKIVDTIHESRWLTLYTFLHEKINHNKLTREDIEDYSSYKKCLLTIPLDDALIKYKELDHPILLNTFYMHLSLFLNHPKTISEMLSEDSAKKVTDYMLLYINAFELTFSKPYEEDKYTIKTKEETRNFINLAPFLISVLENKYTTN